jgi:hypothetical protein
MNSIINIRRFVAGIFVGLFIGVNCHAQSFLTNGLVSFYPFHGNANDAIGTNNGTVYNAVLSANRFGQTNSAYLFDGSSAYIDLGQPANLAFTNNFTLSAWCLFNGGPNNPRIISYHEGYGYDLFTQSAGSCRPIGCYIGFTFFQTGSCFPQNVWHSVVMAVTNGYSTIYVDGAIAGVSPVGVPTFQSDLYIGRSDGDDFWGGLISDVRFYNTALSSNQIAQLYQIESSPPPTLVITGNLTNSYVVYGQNTTLNVTASGASPLNYQWYFVPANNAGQAGAYAETIGGFVYGAVVTNGGFGYGNVPNVSFVGGGGSGAAGYGTVSNGIVTGITVTNAGYGYSSVPSISIDAPNGYLYGQTNSTLTISNANQNSLGNYYVVVSNANASVTSSMVNLTVLYPPSVLFNPIGFTQSYGASNALSVVAAGTPPLSYQWSLNGTNIYNATNSNYSIAGLDITNTGSYIVEVTNSYGYVYSSPVYVNMLPTLTTPFAGAVSLWGQSVELNVGAVGSDILNYQWYFNGLPISGATSSSYNLNSIQFTNAGLYSVVVSSIYGSVTNMSYQVVVNPANTAIGTCPEIYITGTIGYNYTIQSSTNLANTNSWVTVTNITLNATSEMWADTATDTSKSGNPQKFYRVLPGQ